MRTARTLARTISGLSGAVMLALDPGSAAAQDVGVAVSEWADKFNSRVRLVGVRPAPGRVVAGVEIELAEGWKTYWRNPGDSGGVPPSFDWSRSQNVASARVLYPAPRRMSDKAGDTIGYKGTVVLPVEIEAKDAARPVKLVLALDYGICKDLCVPSDAVLSLALDAPSGAGMPMQLAAALDRVPRQTQARRAGDPELVRWSGEPTQAPTVLTLVVRVPGGAVGEADAFLEAPEGMFVPLPRRSGVKADEVTFMVNLAAGGDPAELRGKSLKVTLVGKDGASETSLQLP